MPCRQWLKDCCGIGLRAILQARSKHHRAPMSLLPHQLELLSPARDADIGIEAVNHGADAVYIGGPAFGARATVVGCCPR